MKKKIMSCLLAMSLVASSGSYAFAAATELKNEGDQANVKLTKKVEEEYTVVIPDEIKIPNSDSEEGSEIKIEVSEGGTISATEFILINIVHTGDAHTDSDHGVVAELRNGASVIYSPLRLAKDSSVSIHDGDVKKFSTTGTVACFGATSDTDGKVTKRGLSKDGYELYAYRGYTDKYLDNVADEELVAGTYTGTVTFELTLGNEATTASLGLQTGNDHVVG